MLEKLTPLQITMRKLAGLYSERDDDAEYIAAITKARDELCKRTGVDFGFNIRMWHEHIMGIAALKEEYCWGYSYQDVQKSILDMVNDARRSRVAGLTSE